MLINASCLPSAPGAQSPTLDLILALLRWQKSTIIGTISGLRGTADIYVNGENRLSLISDGDFSLSDVNGTYTITVIQRATHASDSSKWNWSSQNCTVSPASGTVDDSNPVPIQVTCSESPVLVDQQNGNYWMRCAAGMTYDAATSSCAGTASLLQYCSTDTDNCNDLDPAGETGVSGHLTTPSAGDSSQALDSCNSLNSIAFGGKTNWRVPRISELRQTVTCSTGPDAPLSSGSSCNSGSTVPYIDSVLFPNFPETQILSPTDIWFWSSSSDTSMYAHCVGYSANPGGMSGCTKTNGLYLLCLAGP